MPWKFNPFTNDLDYYESASDEAVVLGLSGRTAIQNGASTVSPSFTSSFSNALYIPLVQLENSNDDPVSKYGLTISTKTADGFTVTMGGDAVSGYYILNWQVYSPDIAMGEVGQENIPNGSSTVSVVYETALSGVEYPLGVSVENTVDSDPSCFLYTVTKSGTGFTIELSGTVDTPNYYVNYHIGNLNDTRGRTAVSGTSADVIFDTVKVNNDYALIVTMDNETDDPLSEYGYIVNKDISGFTVYFSDTLETSNYSIDWYAGTVSEQEGGSDYNIKRGEQNIPSGVDEVEITFASVFDDANYTLSIDIQNTVDDPTSQYVIDITGKTGAGFTVQLSETTNSANYILNWIAIE